MHLRKNACLRRSIEWGLEQDEGTITLVSGLFFSLFLAVLLVGFLQMEMVRSSSSYMEDALAASGLASALIDLEEYGISHTVRIADAESAYAQYLMSLKANLRLDENWECENQKLICGQVKLENYTVYNVSGSQVEYCRMDDGSRTWHVGKLGEVCAPNGQIIEKTGVYGEISYPFRGLWGMTVQARKGKLVDIASEN